MANSERYLILSKVIEVLESITVANGYSTDVAYVSDKLQLKHPEELDKNKFPACFPVDDDEDKEALALMGGSGDDMLSTLTIIVTSMVYDGYGETAEPRSDLIRDVEKAMVGDTGLTNLLLEKPTPTRVETDKGYFGNYSVFNQEFTLQYVYDHTTGG